jgi:trans-aconitate methyltransferase
MSDAVRDAWDAGQPYEQYMGRWSRRVAESFLHWIGQAPGMAWADVGCGTGALTSAILADCQPASVAGIDSSAAFISQARQRLADPRVRLEVADAARLPVASGLFDVAVSGLVLNFVPDQELMLREMARVTRPGGMVAVYVWDYADGMQMLRYFWDAATEVDSSSSALDEAARFPVCRPEPLRALFEKAGLEVVAVHGIEVSTMFENFDDFWKPFLGKTGPAPAYVASLNDTDRECIRRHLEARLVPSGSGRIELKARAWAARGVVA